MNGMPNNYPAAAQAPKFYLYVWKDVFTDYTSGIAFALARNVDEAREMVAAKEIRPEHKASVMKELAGEPEVFDGPAGDYICGGG